MQIEGALDHIRRGRKQSQIIKGLYLNLHLVITMKKGANTPDRVPRKKHVEYLYQILYAIRNVNQLIVTEKNRDTLLEKACHLMIETKRYTCCRIIYTDADGNVEKIYDTSPNLPSHNVKNPLESYPCSKIISGDRVTVISDPETTCDGCPLYSGDSGHSVLAAALRHERRRYGVLAAEVPRGMTDPEELALFKEVAGDIGYALHALDAEEDRARAIDALRESEKQLRSLLDSGGDGVTVNVLGKLVYVCLLYTSPSPRDRG